MITKTKAFEMAQRDSDRQQKPMMVLNLNRVGSPLYVVRSYSPGDERLASFVDKVEPAAPRGWDVADTSVEATP